LLGEPFVRGTPEAQQYFDHFTKAITDWHETAAGQVKDVLGMAGISPNGNTVAKKE